MPQSKRHYKRKMTLRKREENTFNWSRRKAASMTDEEKNELLDAVLKEAASKLSPVPPKSEEA